MDDSPPTLKVTVSGQFNAVAFERQVFGIKPEDLEECDLPPANMPVGSLDLTPEQVRSILPFPLLCKTPTKGEVN